MNEVVWIDGRVHARTEARISAFDHGFLYGDSIYETIRTSQGKPFLLDRHLHRLRCSATLMELTLDRDDASYRDAILAALAAVDNTESAIRVVVTRGIGDLGYERHLCSTTTTLVYVRPMVPVRDTEQRQGVQVSIVDIRRNDRTTVSPAAKTSNLLNNILGSFQAQNKGATEGIMLNRDGDVAEGTMSNLFIVCGGQLLTASLDVGILPGITRQFVLELADHAAIPVQETRFRPAQLIAADEAFLTGTTKGILPIIGVDEHIIGNGRPGPVTKRLIHLFDETEDRLVAATAADESAAMKRPSPAGENRR